MGLTLNTNSLTVASSGGGGSAASGLSTSDVENIIHSKTDFVLLKTYEITTAISSFTVPSTDMDHTVYDKFRFEAKGLDFTSSNAPYIATSGYDFFYVRHRHNSQQTGYGTTAFLMPTLPNTPRRVHFKFDFQWIGSSGAQYFHGYLECGMQSGNYNYGQMSQSSITSGNTTGADAIKNNGLIWDGFSATPTSGYDNRLYLYGSKKVT